MTEVGFKSFFKKFSRLYITDNESMFCASNKLTVHPSKCKLQQFGKKHIELKEIKLGGEKLDYTTNFKYLGVLLDCELNFSDQIESVCTKLRKFNGIMYRARTCFSKYHLLCFYSAYIIPIMSYGLIAYGCVAQKVIWIKFI